MIRLTSMEQAGLALAVMSDKRDGDCGTDAAAAAFRGRLNVRVDRLVRLRQVHGTRIVDVAAIDPVSRLLPEADGVMTSQPRVALGIGVADCAPVLLYNPVRGAVAALHSGREGVRGNIAAAGVEALRAQCGGSSGQIVALIGPCARICCYEVSPEMAADWRAAGLPGRGRNLDMSAAICAQLENAGVIRHNIHVVPHCTVCGGGFFSYRADKTSHRNLVVVML